MDRSHLLAVAVVLWSAALAVGGAAPTFRLLILSRIALGVLSAVAGPAVSSMSGSIFPLGQRGSAYGVLLAGELVGAGVGLICGGIVASLVSWRGAWFLLAFLGACLAILLWRFLPDPGAGDAAEAPDPETTEIAPRSVLRALPSPDVDKVLHGDPSERSVWWAIRYVLSIRSNQVLILASTMGYFFFAALRTFAFLLLQSRYGLNSFGVIVVLTVVGATALCGVVAGGRLSDTLMRRGRVDGRPWLVAVTLFGTAVGLCLALASDNIWLALAPLALATAAMGATNPPLDAARLDIVVSRMRGRAEGVRTVCRAFGESTSPLVLGAMATALGATSVNSRKGTATTGQALALTFIITQALVVVAAALVFVYGRRRYPRDVATAIASELSARSWEVEPQSGIE
jgi:predicted MFS family arabinose efflux permease